MRVQRKIMRSKRRARQLAVALGVSRSHWIMLESGQRKPSLRLAIRTADSFRTPLERNVVPDSPIRTPSRHESADREGERDT